MCRIKKMVFMEINCIAYHKLSKRVNVHEVFYLTFLIVVVTLYLQ